MQFYKVIFRHWHMSGEMIEVTLRAVNPASAEQSARYRHSLKSNRWELVRVENV